MTQQDFDQRSFDFGKLVGILEGEGCFSTSSFGRDGKKRRYPVIQLSMTDGDVVQWVADYLEAGKVKGPYQKRTPTGKLGKPVYVLSITGWAAIECMEAIRPYMSERRQQQITERTAEFEARSPMPSSHRRILPSDHLPMPYPELHDQAWLTRRYVELGQTLPDIAKELGCAKQSVWVALKRLDIPRRAGDEARPRYRRWPMLRDREWLLEQYATKTTDEIGVELGCDGGTVLNALKEHGIARRARHTRPKQEV